MQELILGFEQFSPDYFSDLSKSLYLRIWISAIRVIMKNYISRSIDRTLLEWKERDVHKPLLLRGALQVGKSIAEIDYLTVQDMYVLPIEVKAGTQGGMKSLWMFMREKHLTQAVRCSLENFGSFDYIDKADDNAVRHVRICPLYAISRLFFDV